MSAYPELYTTQTRGSMSEARSAHTRTASPTITDADAGNLHPDVQHLCHTLARIIRRQATRPQTP